MVEKRVPRRRRCCGGCRRRGARLLQHLAEIRRTFGDLAQEPAQRRPLPSPSAISRMEETITWNRFLERDDAHLMWLRAEGTPWKEICYMLRHQPPDRAPALGLCAQRHRLAAERPAGAPPAGQRFVIERARAS